MGRRTHSLTNLAVTRTAAKRAVPARDSPDAQSWDFADANVRIRGGRFVYTGRSPASDGHPPAERNDDARSGSNWILDRGP